MNRYAIVAHSRTFITILPRHGYEHPSNTEGARQLRWAVALRKPVVVWRLPGRRRIALPDFLQQYHDCTVIDGGKKKFMRELLRWMDRRGFKPGPLQDLEYWTDEQGRT